MWAAWTCPAGPSSEKGPPPSGPAPVRESWPPAVPPPLPWALQALGGPVLRALWSLGPLPCAPCSSRKTLPQCSWSQGFQACLWTSVVKCALVQPQVSLREPRVDIGVQGTRCLQIQMLEGRGRVLKPSPPSAPSLTFLAGGRLASLQVRGLALGLSCQDPTWLGTFLSLSPGGAPDPPAPAFEDCHLPRHRASGCCSTAAPAPPPILHGSPSLLPGVWGRIPADHPLGGKHGGFLIGPKASASEPRWLPPPAPTAFILQKPMGTLFVASRGPAGEYGGYRCPAVGLRGSRDPCLLSLSPPKQPPRE
ncbi:stathmin-3 isoform X1 [Camelus ferus]|uniref:Stathmin-3 isoform X1 n=1 Tax=Camelus ferus TaxID=419612 RepID=A0A8B8RJM0_CAMFR|nr:stathmin-3 isoform X1 [Camelus ferus]